MAITQPISQELHYLEQGVALLDNGDPQGAILAFKQAIDINPGDALAYYNAGVACQLMGNTAHAIYFYINSVEVLPDFKQAYHNMAQAYADENNLEPALDAYQLALQLDPDDYKSAYNLSLLYRKMGNTLGAINTCQHAIKVKPDFAEGFSTLAMMYCEQSQFEKAMVCLEQALMINPRFEKAYLNMGIVLQKSGYFERGLACYGKAQVCKPLSAPARWLAMLSLPMQYDTPSDISRYRHQFEFNLNQLIKNTVLNTDGQKKYALKGIQSTTNFYLQYQGGNDLDLQSKYGQFVHQVMAANYPQWVQIRPMPLPDARHKLRIGYVSAFMCNHTVGTFLSGWVENHDASVFEIHCYHVGNRYDWLTEQLRRSSDCFHHFGGDMEAAARQIYDDQLHILIYSDIGMDPITMQLAALRLAPVQCKGWGHPVTTGLPTMDYYLSSDLMEPEDADQYYSETLVRLPNLALCYRQPRLPQKPKSRDELGLPSDGFIYLTTQSIFKYLPQYDEIFVQIALNVPDARFVFISNPSQAATDRFRRRLGLSFQKKGLDAEIFCHFSPRLKFDDFLSLNMAANVLLDTFEWSGGKTTLEALSCHLPVVTYPGRFMRGRHAYAMLRRIGLTDTIAADKDDYCRIAVRLALDSAFYNTVIGKLSAGRSQLYDDRHFIKILERLYSSIIVKYQTVQLNTLNNEYNPNPMEGI